MADRVSGSSAKDQRMKYLLVAVLAAILLAVIVWPGDTPADSRAADSRTAAAGVRPNSAALRSGPAAGKAAVNDQTKTVRVKSRPRSQVLPASEDELETTLDFNPFAPRVARQPELAGQATSSEQEARQEAADKVRALAAEQRLNEFRGQKISIVLRMSDGTSTARIGKRLVREGEIVNGIRVLSISTDGIVVEAVLEP